MTGVTRYRSGDAARDNVLAIARSQLGYTEGQDNATKYGAWYGMDHVAWCNIFVSWVFGQAGLLGDRWTPKSAYCPGTIDTYRSWGQAHTSPAEGDVLILDNGGHVGIVESVVSSSEVIFISGNTIDPAHPYRAGYTEAQGWGVYRRVHYVRSGDVFGRPDWASAVAAILPAPLKAAPPTGAPPTAAPPPTKGRPMLPMMITVDGRVVTWTGGGGPDAVFVHTDPARIHDLEAHGVRWVKPTDPAHKLYAPVIRAIFEKKAADEKTRAA